MIDCTSFDAASGQFNFRGELTIYQASSARQELIKAFATGSLTRIDLSDISELDTAGLQILLAARDYAERLGLPLIWANPSSAVLSVTGLTNLNGVLASAAGEFSHES